MTYYLLLTTYYLLLTTYYLLLTHLEQVYESDQTYVLLKRYFDGEVVYGQAQLADMSTNLRLASYAHMLGKDKECCSHLISVRTRSLAQSNLTLPECIHVLDKDCFGAPDADVWMSLVRRHVTA